MHSSFELKVAQPNRPEFRVPKRTLYRNRPKPTLPKLLGDGSENRLASHDDELIIIGHRYCGAQEMLEVLAVHAMSALLGEGAF